MLYYCQGWHVAWTGEPLFEESIEAWANGHVAPDLWRAERHERPLPEPREVDEVGLAAVGYVVSRYGRLNGRELTGLTHAEPPWLEVSQRYHPGDWFDQEISHGAFRSFFRSDEEHANLQALADEALSLPTVRKAIDHPEAAGYVDDPAEINRRLLTH